MAKIFVIGSTGGVGSRLVPKLLEENHEITALCRKESQAEHFHSIGVTPHLGDISKMTEQNFIEALHGHDAVVFTAGAGSSPTDTSDQVDRNGVIKSVKAAEQAGVKRYYLVSAFMDADRSTSSSAGFEKYMQMKRVADVALAKSSLDWVILRPGTLVSSDGDGFVSAGPAIEYNTVSRGNVAEVIKTLINMPSIKKHIIELTDGKTLIIDALNAYL